mmetsp:Transcript_15171/g.42765  ORF Transcript_15171/g.42765 Transcript_15171/m.42765 type:complete len:212 (+) Transcript_15171:1171-1806(+)
MRSGWSRSSLARRSWIKHPRCKPSDRTRCSNTNSSNARRSWFSWRPRRMLWPRSSMTPRATPMRASITMMPAMKTTWPKTRRHRRQWHPTRRAPEFPRNRHRTVTTMMVMMMMITRGANTACAWSRRSRTYHKPARPTSSSNRIGKSRSRMSWDGCSKPRARPCQRSSRKSSRVECRCCSSNWRSVPPKIKLTNFGMSWRPRTNESSISNP